VRLRRPREAARLARGWPVAGTTGFCRRIVPVLKRWVRRLILDRRYRGSEDVRIEAAS
jgi:hypothetical protein